LWYNPFHVEGLVAGIYANSPIQVINCNISEVYGAAYFNNTFDVGGSPSYAYGMYLDVFGFPLFFLFASDERYLEGSELLLKNTLISGIYAGGEPLAYQTYDATDAFGVLFYGGYSARFINNTVSKSTFHLQQTHSFPLRK
jgi:hypothetical protein